MPTFEQRLAAMHEDPAYKAGTPEQRANADHALYESVRGPAQTAASVQLKAARDQPGFAGKAADFAQRAAATFNGIGQTATAGYAIPMAAKLSNLIPASMGGQISEPQLQGQADALSQVSPGGTAAGQVEGAFVGPISKGIGAVAQGAGNLARGGLGLSALEQTFGKRLLGNLVANVAGGVTAVGTYEAGKYQEMPGISERLANAAYGVGAMAKNPLALGMLAAGSAAQAKFLRPQAAENATAIDHFERVTGQKVPIEVLTDSADQRAAYDAMARTPGVQDRIAAQRQTAIDGLKTMLEDYRSRTGAAGGGREAVRDRAAGAVRNIVGTADRASPVTAQRTGAYKTAVAANAAPSQQAAQILDSAVDAIRGSRSKLAKSSLDGVFDDIKKIAADGGGFNAQDLEELRQRVGGLGKFASAPGTATAAESGTRTTAEAKQLYTALTTAAQRTAPDYANALNLSKTLHRMEDALGEVPVVQMSDAQAAGFFKGGNLAGRWDALVQNSRPEDVAALKGWYWYRLVRSVANGKNNTINPETLDKLTSREGVFNSENVDRVLGPQALRDLRSHAEFSSKLFGKGRFGAEGSSTAGRVAQYGTQLASAGAAAAAMHLIGSLSDPFSGAATLLGPVAARAALRSAIGGLIEEQLQRGARIGAQPIGMGANALNQGLQQAPQPLGIAPRPGPITSLNQGGSQ